MSFRALNTGVSGIRQFQTSLDIIGNNLANISTVGYKSARVDFSDTLNQTLRPATADTSTRSGSASVQVGNGVAVAGVVNAFTQGAVNQTGVTTDMAVSGEGFFVVKKLIDSTNSELFATRAGDFHLDSAGFLVTNQGYRVQGITDTIEINQDYTVASAGKGDIKFDKGTLPAGITSTAEISTINVDSNGKINLLLTDGTQYTRGQILLQKFNNPNALLKQGNNLYSGLATAGPATTNLSDIGFAPNTSGLGRIDSGALEISNVDIAREFANMITTQRAFQANARVVTASDDMLQEMIRVVR
jgi:flagellar hook protein FlgE